MATQANMNAFINDPATFLKKNVVWWRGGAPEDQANIQVAMLDSGTQVRRSTSVLGRKVDGNNFELRYSQPGAINIPQGSPIFPAVWSGYAGNTAKNASLPSAGGPDIMLTAQLTGCTVVAKVHADGSADFSHYNLKVGNSTLDEADMNAIAEAHFGGGQSTLTKESMRATGKHSDAVTANVIGIRKAGRWAFYAQMVESKAVGNTGTTWQIREVRKIA